MKFRLLAMMTCLAVPTLARAQPVTGLYVAAGAGLNLKQSAYYRGTYHEDAFSLPGPFTSTFPAFTTTYSGKTDFHAGPAAVASIGYGLGNGLRLELEGDFLDNKETTGLLRKGRNPYEKAFGGIGNVLYDLDAGVLGINPYVGLGAGYMRIDSAYGGDQKGAFAYQAIVGAAVPLQWVPGLSLTVEYRFMGLGDTRRSETYAPTAVSSSATRSEHYDTDLNHGLLIGVRYVFGAPAAPPPQEAPAAAPAPAPARTYLVFFDWDRAELSGRAQQIIAEAATASTRVQITRIEVEGHADRSGTPAYNQGLSLRRAQAVAAELVKRGVPRSAIDLQAFGDTRPLVPTAGGVREPQNRRVEIILR